MASIKQILPLYPWKNYKNFNWNRSFIWPTLHFAWFKLALWSRKTPTTVLNFWRFRRQSTLNASQTWLQSNEVVMRWEQHSHTSVSLHLGLPVVLPLWYKEKPQNLPWKKTENNKKTQTYKFKKSQNQAWKASYRYLHIKIKVIYIICIIFLTSSSLLLNILTITIYK